MQIVCPKCQTKYSLPDERVAGKILKVKCKKCGNIIVVRGTKKVLEKKKREHRERITSSRARAVLRKAFEEDTSIPEDEFGSERTQIARMPKLEEFAQEEEWYLADSRGQFGPMTFNELVARLKRGEPEPDAVVWREGFDDWRPIEDVPELRPYHKPAPPPRRREEPVQSQAIPQQQAPVMSAPVYPATESQIITQAPIPWWQSRFVPFAIGAVVAGLVAFVVVKMTMKPQVVERVKVVEKEVPPTPVPTAKAKEDEGDVLVLTDEPADDQQDQQGQQAKQKRRKTQRSKPSLTVPSKESKPKETGRTRAQLEATMYRYKTRLMSCYRRTVRKGFASLMDHKITFILTIAPDGTVTSVDFKGKLPPLTRNCFTRKIKGWKFPPGTKTDRYSFTMIFEGGML